MLFFRAITVSFRASTKGLYGGKVARFRATGRKILLNFTDMDMEIDMDMVMDMARKILPEAAWAAGAPPVRKERKNFRQAPKIWVCSEKRGKLQIKC